MTVRAPFDQVCRYLGCRGEVEPALAGRIRALTHQVEEAAQPRTASRIFPLSFPGGDRLALGPLAVESAALGKNLAGCEEVILFAATLGVGVDRLIARFGAGRVSDAAVYQAAGAALIEEVCDQAWEELRRAGEAEGWHLRPRFSPGYGDFPLSCQRELLTLLRAPETIGLTAGESMLLLPTKSVTAVMGRSRLALPCHRTGCEACGKTDCAFRR